MVEPLRHRQPKGAETDMFDQLPRHISTLPETAVAALQRYVRSWSTSRHGADIVSVLRNLAGSGWKPP